MRGVLAGDGLLPLAGAQTVQQGHSPRGVNDLVQGHTPCLQGPDPHLNALVAEAKDAPQSLVCHITSQRGPDQGWDVNFHLRSGHVNTFPSPQ